MSHLNEKYLSEKWHKAGFDDGVREERKRSKVLVEALKSISDDSIGTWVNGKEQTIIEVCEEALRKYEETGK